MKIFSLTISLLFLGPFVFAQTNDQTQSKEALERRQKAEMIGYFLKDPSDSQLPTTALAVNLYNQGVELFNKNEYDLARQAFKDSLSYDDQNALAYERLAEIDYREQNLTEAKANYEIAYALQPRAELKEKIEKLAQETKVEKKLSTYREQHFIIKYHNEDKNLEGFELRELLRGTYKAISQDFAYYFKHQVVVLLYDEEEFRKITNVPHWAGGLYDGKVRMPVSKKGFHELELKALTTHEITHAFVAAMSGNLAPAWINEGLAEYEENKVRQGSAAVFKSALKTKTLLPLDQLMSHRSSAAIQNPLMVTLFYEQSHELLKYMIGRYGMFRIKQLLEGFANGKDSDATLRAILRISPARLEKEWKDTLPK